MISLSLETPTLYQKENLTLKRHLVSISLIKVETCTALYKVISYVTVFLTLMASPHAGIGQMLFFPFTLAAGGSENLCFILVTPERAKPGLEYRFYKPGVVLSFLLSFVLQAGLFIS